MHKFLPFFFLSSFPLFLSFLNYSLPTCLLFSVSLLLCLFLAVFCLPLTSPFPFLRFFLHSSLSILFYPVIILFSFPASILFLFVLVFLSLLLSSSFFLFVSPFLDFVPYFCLFISFFLYLPLFFFLSHFLCLFLSLFLLSLFLLSFRRQAPCATSTRRTRPLFCVPNEMRLKAIEC